MRYLPILTVFYIFVGACVAVAADLPAIDAFTKHMQTQKGFYDVSYDAPSGRVYVRVVGTETFLFQSSMPQGIGSNDIGLDRGQLGDTRLVQFARFGSKVLLRQLNTQFRASSANHAEVASVDEAFADSVIAGFSIVAEDNDAVLIDYTDFLLSDIHGIAKRLKQSDQGAYSLDKSRSGVYMPRTRAFPDNTEFEALVTFAGTGEGNWVRDIVPDPNSISVHLHHSLVRLPDDNFTPRAFHPMSGFWKQSHFDYSRRLVDSLEVAVIPRHRLHKKDPSAAVSEAVEPIVYYLDPGIPEPIYSALRDGALWWNQAFEAAGYHNAFRVERLPEGADPMDVRYNLIQWVHRATRGWSYGSSVIDPRTGEIIKGHVTLGSLRVRQDYLIALGLTSPFIDENASTDAQQQMALARIRQLSAHEVGHTLGISHNFAASANHRASVMDYPHPRLRLINQQIDLSQAYDTGIGEWDKHVIAYGYTDFPKDVSEPQALAAIVENVKAKGLAYKSDPDARGVGAASADGHLWDEGNDVLVEFDAIMAIRKAALAKFGLASLPVGENLSSLAERLVPIYLLHRYQLEAVVRQIGGRDYQYEQRPSSGGVKGVSVVSKQRQQAALNAVMGSVSSDNLQLSSELLRLIPPNAYGEQTTRESFSSATGYVFDPVMAAESITAYSLSLLLHPQRLNRIAQQHAFDSDQVGIVDVLNAVTKGLILPAQWPSNSIIAARQQLVALDYVVKASQDNNVSPEVRAQVFEYLDALLPRIKKYKQTNTNTMVRWLSWYLERGDWQGGITTAPLPPGSPI